MPVLPNHELMDRLADRIEDAYGLRRSLWWRGCSTTRVWNAAAQRLWEAHAVDPIGIPLDAELFVAAQPISTPLSDPWSEIAHPESSKRYRTVVRQIVRQLRGELRREVARAERSIQRGVAIDSLLSRRTHRISALACFIVSRRAGREDLANRWAPAAASQHRSCPLYRAASLTLIPAEFYPDERLALEFDQPVTERVTQTALVSRGKYRECQN